MSNMADAEGVWRTLVAADQTSTFFSTPSWLSPWWCHYGSGRRLALVAAFDDTTPVAFAPLMVQIKLGIPWVSFLGTPQSDYADFLVNEQRVSREEAIHSILTCLVTWVPGALIDLQQIPETSPSVRLVQSWAKKHRLHCTAFAQDLCPVISLPQTLAAYHGQLKKGFLADIRRGERRLRERGTVRIVDHLTPTDGDWTTLKDEMTELQSQRMRAKGQIPMWQGPMGSFVKDVLQSSNRDGCLRLTGLYLNEHLIAYEMCFLHRRSIYSWSRAFANNYKNTGPGKIALLHVLSEGIREGRQTLDLLRGEEGYKTFWANDVVRNYRVLLELRASLGSRVAYQWVTNWHPRLRRSTLLINLYHRLKSFRASKR